MDRSADGRAKHFKLGNKFEFNYPVEDKIIMRARAVDFERWQHN